jgi:hypothetical protein
MKAIETIPVVNKLIGNISPRGESNADNISLENLQEYIKVIEAMIDRVIEVGKNNEHSYEASVVKHVDFIDESLDLISEKIKDRLN